MAGHVVAGLARSPAKQTVLVRLGARAAFADPFDERSLREAFDGQDVIVNLMTHIPRSKDTARYGSSIWLDDAGSAVAAALGAPAGTYNVVDDEPLPRAQSAAELAAAVGRERLCAPLAVLGPILPPARALRRSQRVSNRALHEATGWAPAVPSVREGWPRIVRELAAGPAAAPRGAQS